MESKICKRCNKQRSLKFFSKFIAITKKGKETRIRSICYDCNYKNARYPLTYLTDEERLIKLKNRFENYVIRKNGCWDWKGFIRPDGYTRMRFGSKYKRHYSIGGHVASWMIKNWTIDLNNLFVLHKCDNRKCTNPEHLYLGSNADNMRDMARKKRNPIIKLSISKVRNIKKLLLMGVPLTKISKKYKVHWATINDIKNGKTWHWLK